MEDQRTMEELSASESSVSPAAPAGVVVTAFLFALSLGILAPIIWLATAFLAMVIGQHSEVALTVIGYLQIGLVPLSVGGGAVVGLVLGLIPRGRARKRWLIGAGIITFVALVVNVGMALLLR
jgi:hypothetical protein